MKLTKRFFACLMMAGLLLAVLLVCVCLGSVKIPLGESFSLLWHGMTGNAPEGVNSSIVLSLRLPRVLCACLMGVCYFFTNASG